MPKRPAAKTPTVAIARVLRDLGLKQGRGKDFSVAGIYKRGERQMTYVTLYGQQARDLVAEHADEVEEQVAASGFSFTVSIRRDDSGRPFCTITNGCAAKVRQDNPVASADQDNERLRCQICGALGTEDGHMPDGHRPGTPCTTDHTPA